MRSLAPLWFLCLVLSPIGTWAQGDTLSVELTAQVVGESPRTARDAPTDDVIAVLTTKPGAKIRVRWAVTNEAKAAAVPDVTIHVTLIPGRAKDHQPPSAATALYESALVTDISAITPTLADFVIEAPGPGTYALRVETIGAGKAHGHEHTASMELRVQ